MRSISVATPCDGQVLLADNLFVDMAGVFEYDLELKEKGDHRKFLTQTASFKQVRELVATRLLLLSRRSYTVHSQRMMVLIFSSCSGVCV